MATISNPGRWPLTLPTGHVVPAFGSLPTTNDVIRSADNFRMLGGMKLAGQVDYQLDEDPKLPEATASFEPPATASHQASPETVELPPVVMGTPEPAPPAPVDVAPEAPTAPEPEAAMAAETKKPKL